MNQESADPNLDHLEMVVEVAEEIRVMAGINPAVAEAAAVVEEIHGIAEIKTVAVKVEIITTIIPPKKVGDPIDIQLQTAKVILRISD